MSRTLGGRPGAGSIHCRSEQVRSTPATSQGVKDSALPVVLRLETWTSRLLFLVCPVLLLMFVKGFTFADALVSDEYAKARQRRPGPSCSLSCSLQVAKGILTGLRPQLMISLQQST